MEISYFADTDTLAISFRKTTSARTEYDDDGTYIIYDVDSEGCLTLLTLEHASERVDLSKLLVEGLAIPITMVGTPLTPEPTAHLAGTLDLVPEHLTIVRDILAQHVPGVTVWAFGSRTTGRAAKYSDLDIALAGDAPITTMQFAVLEDAFSESLLPMMVDVIDWGAISDEFRDAVAADRVLIHSATPPPPTLPIF